MRLIVTFGFVFVAVPALSAPQDYRTTPVPILKQVNRQNDDGSYSYGYEGADGTFRIETKYPSGEVYGKYGYIGDDGKLREVEYGATKRGFEPKGSDISVAPPSLSNTIDQSSADYDDGQYREDPSIYYKRTSSQSQTPLAQTAFTTRYQAPAKPFIQSQAPLAQTSFTTRYQTPARPQSRYSFPYPIQSQPYYTQQYDADFFPASTAKLSNSHAIDGIGTGYYSLLFDYKR